MAISSPLVANVLPIINLPMALGNLPIASNGLPLVPIGNDIQVVMTYYCIINLFSDTILHGASNEPEVYLELSQTSMRECFCQNN